MRLRNRKSPLLLLLLPSLAVAAAAAVADQQSGQNSIDGSSSGRRYGTKDAPVDGNDGKPHTGPFIELGAGSETPRDLPALKDRPDDPLIVNGERIPKSHDGVMDDKNRPGPKKGTTGTEGGVSEKAKNRRLREQTGKRAENKPPTPKEAPPPPHADQGQADDRTSTDASGLEVSAPMEDGSSLFQVPVN
jgi:hypothetical protein